MIYRHTIGVDNQKSQGRNDAATSLNHVATSLSYKLLFQCPNQPRTAESMLWEKT